MSGSTKNRILVLDDDPLVLSALERILRQDFDLVLSQDIPDALTALRQQQFELVLVDLHLHKDSGLSFLQQVRDQDPSLVRVLMSGALNLQAVVDSLDSSLAHKILQKPWEPAALLVLTKEALQLRQILKDKILLEELSTTDAMTGLHNFRYLQDFLPREFERAKRQARPLSLLMIDVDHFKIWNDEQGHAKGNELVRHLSSLLKESLRSFDHICRYGGDEFCVLLQETDLQQAFEIAERLRQKVQDKSRATVSLGVSCYPSTSLSSEQLMSDADAALYSAKKQGRNRSVVAAAQEPG